jgi:hypothetical protein
LSWYEDTEFILTQEVLKGSEMALKHLKDPVVPGVFVVRLEFSPVVKKTVTLNLDNPTVVM